jgi:hypothetical protein
MRPWLWALAPCVPLLLDGGRLLNQNNMHRPTQSHTAARACGLRKHSQGDVPEASPRMGWKYRCAWINLGVLVPPYGSPPPPPLLECPPASCSPFSFPTSPDESFDDCVSTDGRAQMAANIYNVEGGSDLDSPLQQSSGNSGVFCSMNMGVERGPESTYILWMQM